MAFNATFNNFSAISWWSVLLVEETVVPEKTTDLHTLVASAALHHRNQTGHVIGTECTSKCKSIYHTIAVTLTPKIVSNEVVRITTFQNKSQ
jgi:hypothetical protein